MSSRTIGENLNKLVLSQKRQDFQSRAGGRRSRERWRLLLGWLQALAVPETAMGGAVCG